MTNWFVALHLIAVISWFAGLFYLPRLFVYHASAMDTISQQRFVIMERKLLTIIMAPAALISTLTGIHLVIVTWSQYHLSGWLYVKLVSVLLLYGFHYHCWKYYRAFRDGCNQRSEKFYRVFNEVPTVLLFVIIIMVVVKPF